MNSTRRLTSWSLGDESGPSHSLHYKKQAMNTRILTGRFPTRHGVRFNLIATVAIIVMNTGYSALLVR